jgi:predicted membrane channel-forming protein YqfA (hemolysin III family)
LKYYAAGDITIKMKNLLIYRIASYLLLPIAALMGFATLLFLMAALGNFAMLFPVFIAGSTVIYIFASFSFLQKIDRKIPCKPSLKDWIKVNGFVAMFFVAQLLTSVIFSITNPALTNQAIESMIETQGSSMKGIDPEMVKRTMKGMFYFMGLFGVVLFFHIFVSFRLLKQYAVLFGEGGNTKSPE